MFDRRNLPEHVKTRVVNWMCSTSGLLNAWSFNAKEITR